MPTEWLESTLLSNFMCSINISAPTVVREKGVFSWSHIKQICQLLRCSENEFHYKTAYLLAFMAFLRISDLTSTSYRLFDHIRQLCWQDVEFIQNGAVITLRWAKNLQKVRQSHKVHVPSMPDKNVCPVTALSMLHRIESHTKVDPLLKLGGGLVTESMLRKRLAFLLRSMGLPVHAYTFHAFRRSGASLAFNMKVPFESIQNQGAWVSDAIWAYLFSSSDRVSAVAEMFRGLDNSCLGAS